MAQLVNHSFCNLTFNIGQLKTKGGTKVRKVKLKSFCCELTEDKWRSVVKNGKDMLDICKVVNGMWQTSGGWGRIDRDNAVDSMLHYANAGLTTFDMADICKVFASHTCVCVIVLLHHELCCNLFSSEVENNGMLAWLVFVHQSH